jgi:S1-C subfamily serine protease
MQAGIAATVTPSAPAARAIATDRPTGLVLMATEQTESVTVPRPALTRPGPATQYLFAATPLQQGLIDVRPVYVSLWPGPVSPAWRESVWNISGDPVAPGAFLFTAAGELVGTVVRHDQDRVVVPSAAFYAAAERLLMVPVPTGTGSIGVEVTPLTAPIAAATGTRDGVLIVHVDGTAAATLAAGDIITAVNDVPVTTREDWSAIVDRLRVGEEVRLRRVTTAGPEEVRLPAEAPPAGPAATFGARLERVRGRTQVMTIDAGSAAADAGLAAGDVITRAGSIVDPTPAQVTRALASEGDTPLLVLYTRGDAHHATAVAR